MTTFAERLLVQDREKRLLAQHREKSAAGTAEKAVDRFSISEAAKRTGISRDTIYRLYKAGFVKGWMPGPKKVLIDANDLGNFLVVSAIPGFWTPERRTRYNGKAVG